MFRNIKFIINIILIVLCSKNYLAQIYEWSFEKTIKGGYCPDKFQMCFFNITSDYNISPKIPFSFTINAADYKYFYLVFYIPSSLPTKSFIFEAYETTKYRSIIYGGDIYSIDTTQNIMYEMRFPSDFQYGFFQLRFLNLPDNFFMVVECDFIFDLTFLFRATKLTFSNSAYLDSPTFKELNEKLLKEEEERQKRIEKASQNAAKIFEGIFNDHPIDIYFPKKDVVFRQIIHIPPLIIVQLTISVKPKITIDSFFDYTEDEISKTKVIKGIIDVHSDGIDLLDDNLNIDSDIIKYLGMYHKDIGDLIFNFGLETESYSVTIHINPETRGLVITITFFLDYEIENIDYEIEIEIQPNNHLAYETVPVYVPNFDLELLYYLEEVLAAMSVLDILIILFFPQRQLLKAGVQFFWLFLLQYPIFDNFNNNNANI